MTKTKDVVKSTTSIYLKTVDADLWAKFAGLSRMLQMTQKGAVEEALADWITKHKKDVTL